MGQGISSFHREFDLFYMFHAESFSADDTYAYRFAIFTGFKAIITFQHMTISTNLIKQAILFQGFMAGDANNPFDMLDIGF
jgi:hypothetical protein